MTDFGFETGTTSFTGTVHAQAIQKAVVETLRAGLVCAPKGSVIPADLLEGSAWVLRSVEYPDLIDSAATTPLTEGVPPTVSQLGVDYQDVTAVQTGAFTNITDVSAMQSPHDLRTIASQKIARLAAQKIDGTMLAAFLVQSGSNMSSVDIDGTSGVLTTDIVLDAVSELQARDVQPVPGAGYYAVCHPYALRGLLNEDGITGWTDAAKFADPKALTAGAVGAYRGVTFLTSSRIVGTAPEDNGYPVYFFGQSSLIAGDVSSFEYFTTSGPSVSNPLNQIVMTAGFKGVLGCAIAAFKETTNGSGTNGSAIPRFVSAAVQSGQSITTGS